MSSLYPMGIPYAIAVQSAGLTTATTAYTSGDVLGNELQFKVGDLGGSRGFIHQAWLTDAADVVGAVDLFMFSAASTPAADNAANSWSDANIRFFAGLMQVTTVLDSALNKVVVASLGTPIPYFAPNGVLYVVMVTRTANTFFGAVTDLECTLVVEPRQ